MLICCLQQNLSSCQLPLHSRSGQARSFLAPHSLPVCRMGLLSRSTSLPRLLHGPLVSPLHVRVRYYQKPTAWAEYPYSDARYINIQVRNHSSPINPSKTPSPYPEIEPRTNSPNPRCATQKQNSRASTPGLAQSDPPSPRSISRTLTYRRSPLELALAPRLGEEAEARCRVQRWGRAADTDVIHT